MHPQAMWLRNHHHSRDYIPMPSRRCLKYLIVVTIASTDAFVNRRSAYAPAALRPGESQLTGLSLYIARSNYSESATKRSYSSDLDSAYEWLAKDRFLNEPEKHVEIRWFHPNAAIADDDDTCYGGNNYTKVKRMPLYPLGAVHIPHSGENYTIINIEPRNVKMAMDLMNKTRGNALFCATLRARDTNRFASVGTIMQIIDTDDLYGCRLRSGESSNEMPALNRVVAICRAVEVADILSIEECANNEYDYLIAKVRVRDDHCHAMTESESDDHLDFIARQIIDDYQTVRSIYINSQSLASNELPPYARSAVKTLPTFDEDVIHDETKFWKMVETWQMLCNTIRQSKRSKLLSVVNELSVTAAMQAEGPLELPVKRQKLPLIVQKQLEDIEQSASKDFMELGMDPVLDFQEILNMRRHTGRVEKLASMIQRERSRLEAKESLIRAFLELNGDTLAAYSSDDDDNVFD
ncbi:hypothetical protein ACHAW5_011185 [Stephanodiscus triporus]|uniref:Lon N-terminal domain-containing protein n=1 Tax=Stephanodiscus triporus TaxID=2934178 RepID=A0ABD3QZJ8_9STRA